MNCKNVEDLILTDYLDGQMDDEKKKQLEKHLADCASCREYELIARKTVIGPFNDSERVNPPAVIWHKIKEQIEEEEELTSPFADLIRRIKSLLYVPKPAFAVAAIVIILLITVSVIKLPSKNQEIVKVAPENQVECITYLISVFDEGPLNEDNDFETSIEEYFL